MQQLEQGYETDEDGEVSQAKHEFGVQVASKNQHAEEIRDAVRTTQFFLKARKESCVTTIEEVDDVVREESEEQRKQEEEESSEKQRPRASKILDKRVNRKECKTKLRMFRSAVGADMASREEDEVRTDANQLKEERQVPEIHFDYMFMGTEKEG